MRHSGSTEVGGWRTGAVTVARRSHPVARSLGSGGIQADLKATFGQGQEIAGRQGQVAPGFQQAESQVLGSAQTVGEHLAQQAAFLHELEDQVSQLQEQVEDFAGGGVLAVGVFQVEIAVLLDVEAFILDLPTQTATLVGQAVDIAGSQAEIGDPFVAEHGHLPPGIGAGFLALDQVERMNPFLTIGVAQPFGPAIGLQHPLGALFRIDLREFDLLGLIRQVGDHGGKAALEIGQILFA